MNVLEKITKMLIDKGINTAMLLEFTESGKLTIDTTLPVAAWIEIGKILEADAIPNV